MEKENKVDWEWFNQLPSLSICDAVTLSLGYELMSFAPVDFDMSSRNIEAPTEYRQRLFLTYQHAINDKLKRTGRTASIDEPYNQDAQFSDGQFWEIDLADFRRFCDDKKWAVPAEFLPEGYVVPAAIPTEEKPIGTNVENPNNWPWGNYHTKLLGHLDAAARRYWGRGYDPSDNETAATNATVSEWLQTERKVSQTMADAIASILRPDGLPTGPRK